MKKLRICFTSDVHGYFNPVNYGTGKPEKSGLLSLASAFHKDENTLIIDGGDLLQGSPMAMYESSYGHDASIFAKVMNLCGYDYVTIGNHDFNYGREYLLSYLGNLDGKCICCNVDDLTGELPLFSHQIRVMGNGLRVGLIGACTDYVNVWEKAENLKELRVRDVRAALEKEVSAIREQVDVLIGIYHGGFECDLSDGKILTESRENIGCELCRELPFDLICTGHQHMPVAGQMFEGTWIVQTAHNGKHFAEIELEVADEDDGAAEAKADGAAGDRDFGVADVDTMLSRGSAGEIQKQCGMRIGEMDRRSVYTWSSRLVPASDEALASGVALLADLEAEVQTWLDTPVGHFDQPLLPGAKVDMAYYGSPIADLFNRVQLYYSGAQLSCTSLGNDIQGFPADVTARDIVSTYVYQNTLVVLEVTGKVLRQALERCGEYFDNSDGVLKVSEKFLKPKVEHYNYDFFMGIDYEFNVNQPEGSRVAKLEYQGQPVEDDQKFTLCMNNYRASGTGGYEFFVGCPVVKDIQMDMVEMIIGYLGKQ